jgi:hypothetical protein
MQQGNKIIGINYKVMFVTEKNAVTGQQIDRIMKKKNEEGVTDRQSNEKIVDNMRKQLKHKVGCRLAMDWQKYKHLQRTGEQNGSVVNIQKKLNLINRIRHERKTKRRDRLLKNEIQVQNVLDIKINTPANEVKMAIQSVRKENVNLDNAIVVDGGVWVYADETWHPVDFQKWTIGQDDSQKFSKCIVEDE